MQPLKMLPYLSLNEYFKKKYKKRIQKITVSLPFTCPHGQCSYCWQGSMPPGNNTGIPLKKQIEDGILKAKKKYGEDTGLFIYFQTYTNTNDTLENLKKTYDACLGYHDVTGISVGTRPDCVPDEILALIDSYASRELEPWVELGLQSASNETLKKINRGHTVEQFVDAVERAKKTRLKVIAHIMTGFPWETAQDMEKTVKLVSALKVDGLKIHPLHVLDGTPLGEEYKNKKFDLMPLEVYVKTLADMLEILPKDTIIVRFTAEGHPDRLLAPDYCRPPYKAKIKAMLLETMHKRGSIQGCKWRG
jgi:radical SAM protein (TIGR01212 family)